MSSPVLSAAAGLRQVLAGFEPGQYSGADCGRLAEELAATEKACAAARVLAAARAVDCGVHRQRGFGDGAAWLARQSGSSPVQARQSLHTASSLDDCPDTRAALLAGDISLAQAAEIAHAHSDLPDAEQALLPVARAGDLSQLRDHARQHRQAHTQPADLRRQQAEARFFRHWRDSIGMVCFSGALPPDIGLPFVRRVELAAHRLRRAARQTAPTPASDVKEQWEAYAADAVAAITTGTDAGPSRPARAELVIVCDLGAWRRGHAHPGEPCHIIDGGPITVDEGKSLTQDAFIKAALHDGKTISTIKHFGRHIPAELRTALDLGPVPQFTGRQCADCGRRWGLQYDHIDPVANHGPTTYQNIEARCWADHQAKTERDRQSGLLGPHAPRPPNRR